LVLFFKKEHSSLIMFPLAGFTGAFLLGFPALFSIVNPPGSAVIFAQVLAARTHAERRWLAGKVALFSAIVLLVSLWGGSYVLNFFGISLGALRLGGGLVVAQRAWQLLNAPEVNEARKEQQAEPARLTADAAFYPLTMPLTTGPGTISVAVALGAERPGGVANVLPFMLGMSAAALVIVILIWITYRYADGVMAVLGKGGARVMSRLVAFLLLCIGTQIMVNGVEDLAAGFMAAHR
jgi:multiple antibiotic resistance protein